MRTSRQILAACAAMVAVPMLLVASPGHAEADGCADGYLSDFNGDGFSDTVVADPYATVAGNAEAGNVIVLYGDADGRIGEGARATVRQGAGSVGGTPEAGDRFGFALSVADIDCDDFTDLVVGSPYEDIGGFADSGYVQIIWGAATGLGTGDASRNIAQTTFGELVHAGDQFGFAVDALEDVGQGGTPAPDAYALGIGAPGWNVGAAADAGWVGFLHAVDGGNIPLGVTQNTAGVPGVAETGDRFGAALSISYLLGDDDTIDAAVGVPNEDVGAATDAGAVTVLTDVYDGVVGGVGIDQNSAGVPGTAEAGDVFGRSMDTVQAGATNRLAVGVPGEDIGADSNAGSVQLFSSNTFTLTPGAGLSQDTDGVSGAAEPGDLFGDRVAFAPPGLGDAATRLAVSSPYEDGSAVDSGMVQVFPVNSLAGEVTYSQDSPGVPGAVDAGDRFGRELAVVTGVTERAVIIGVPDDVDNTAGMVNVIPFGGGAPRFWEPGTAGVPSAGASRFGSEVAGAGN